MFLLFFISCLQEFPDSPNKQFLDKTDDDFDGDGYSEMDGDCDDNNVLFSPEAQELCDGVDNDCDGNVDEDTASDAFEYYADFDGDGYGEVDTLLTSCDTAVEGYVRFNANTPFDCEPNDPKIHPNAAQYESFLCTKDSDNDGYGDALLSEPAEPGQDCNDEDGLIYPGSVRFEGSSTCALDQDGDGYGDALAPEPYDAGRDCDDQSNTTYPGSSQEIGDVCVLDADGDGYGDITPPEGYDVGTDCDDTDENIFRGAAYLEPTLCIRDADGDGYGTSSAGEPYDAGSDCDDESNTTFPGSSQEIGNLCVLDSDGDGYGDITPPIGYDIGTDCNDESNTTYPGSSQEGISLCVLDSDGDGYGDITPPIGYDVGTDCNDESNTTFPGSSQEIGNVCVLDSDGDGYGDITPPVGYDMGSDCDDSLSSISPVALEFCDEADNNCNGETDELGAVGAPNWYPDADGDGFGGIGSVPFSMCGTTAPTGYAAVDLDCDDTDEDVFPGKIEVCDEKDNDCNNVVDENVQLTFYIDSDEDGFGNILTSTQSCTAPVGYVENPNDCDDDDNNQYPNADEVCNLEDDNCDDNVDEDSSIDAQTWYNDSDGDGFGSMTDSTVSCYAPSNYLSNNEDCDDNDTNQNPNSDEICNGEDDDCDEEIDNNPINVQTFYLDEDGDQDGDPNTGVQSCTVSEGYVSLQGDCDDTNENISSIEPELCSDNIDENCDGDFRLGAVDLTDWYADSDGDTFGNLNYTIATCPFSDSATGAPQGYTDNPNDCDDLDGDLYPGNVEICNGKLDDCDQAEDDSYGPREEEVDNDNDGYIECDFNEEEWATLDIPTGSGDCEDDEPEVYPGAPELCTGVVEDCSSVDYGGTPEDEMDNDGDGYVECSGFFTIAWKGEEGVVGGNDCNDNNEYAFPGASENLDDVTLCTQDKDEDGNPDCVRWSDNADQVGTADYFCDYGVFLTDTVGPDFVRIPAGEDPLGRYTLTNDFYMMTTELTNAMYMEIMDTVIDFGCNSDNCQDKADSPVCYDYHYHSESCTSISWYDAVHIANLLSDFEGLERCYDESTNYELRAEYLGSNIYNCSGYRLPTEAEWEYAARSGTEYDIWTEFGGGDIINTGEESYSHICINTIEIDDGHNSSLLDYAWFCSNSIGVRRVASVYPNAFGLYDMHGNANEWVQDWCSGSCESSSLTETNFPYATNVDPTFAPSGTRKILRGGSVTNNADRTATHYRISIEPDHYRTYYYSRFSYFKGLRLVRTAN